MSRQLQIVILVVLLLVGGVIWGWQYRPSASGSAKQSSFLQGYQPLNFPNSELDWEKVNRRRKAEYKGEGINPFSTAGPQPPVVPVKVPKPGDPNYVEPAPVVPPLPELPPNMKFFGYGTVPNGTPRRAFLSYQDDVYIVSEGDTLMGRYRILKISNASLEFEDVSSGRRGQKMLEDQGPSA